MASSVPVWSAIRWALFRRKILRDNSSSDSVNQSGLLFTSVMAIFSADLMTNFSKASRVSDDDLPLTSSWSSFMKLVIWDLKSLPACLRMLLSTLKTFVLMNCFFLVGHFFPLFIFVFHEKG